MGEFMKEDDFYIEPLLDLLNLHFAPGDPIVEMAALQGEFHIFSDKHSFKDSVRALNLGGPDREVREKWYKLLEWLKRCPSDTTQNGNDRIVSVLVRNLAEQKPSPVYFTYHDGRSDRRVFVTENDRPIFYLLETFLTISLPMIPRILSPS
jgi:hypothetical protein